jgi:5'(3')-deoxyribonucleotidase
MSKKKVVYIDMDGVIVDFKSGVNKLDPEQRQIYKDHYEDVPGIFRLMNPLPGAIEAVEKIAKMHEIFILSTAPWDNPGAWSDKVAWLREYFGDSEGSVVYKRLILSHHKDLSRGHILIDDRVKNGADRFHGKLILFGSEEFPGWESVLNYLINSDHE